MNPTISNCPITYTLTYTSGSAIDATVFTFSTAAVTTSVGASLAVYSITAAKAAVYNMMIKGTLDSVTSVTNTVSFLVTLNECKTSILSTTSSLSSLYTYDITSTALTFLFTAWTSSISSCGSWSYVST